MRLFRKLGELLVDVFTDEYKFRREHPDIFAQELRDRERRRRNRGAKLSADRASRRARRWEARARAKAAAKRVLGGS